MSDYTKWALGFFGRDDQEDDDAFLLGVYASAAEVFAAAEDFTGPGCPWIFDGEGWSTDADFTHQDIVGRYYIGEMVT
jgi:hypothetical protein